MIVKKCVCEYARKGMRALADVLSPRVIVGDFTNITVVISDDVSKTVIQFCGLAQN